MRTLPVPAGATSASTQCEIPWHHDRVDVPVTLAEAATLLDPQISERQLRMIIRALRIPPAGTRPNGYRGRPQHTYPWAELTQLHAALVPWLGITYDKRRTTVLPGDR